MVIDLKACTRGQQRSTAGREEGIRGSGGHQAPGDLPSCHACAWLRQSHPQLGIVCLHNHGPRNHSVSHTCRSACVPSSVPCAGSPPATTAPAGTAPAAAAPVSTAPSACSAPPAPSWPACRRQGGAFTQVVEGKQQAERPAQQSTRHERDGHDATLRELPWPKALNIILCTGNSASDPPAWQTHPPRRLPHGCPALQRPPAQGAHPAG